MSPRSRGLVVVIVLLLAGGGIAAWLLLGREEREESLTLYGNVEVREVVLGFRVPGRLAEMAFQEGDEVDAGAVLARLDPEPYQEALAAAEARSEQARARLDLLESGFRPQEVQQAEARVRQAHAAAESAESNYRRKAGLLESGASSEREVEAARAAREETAARLFEAREALDLFREGFRRQDVEAVRAELAAARAQVEEARTRLADAELLAPSDGVVLTRVHEPGAVVGSGTPVYALSLGDPAYVRAYVAEPDLGRVVPGATVWVTTDSSGERYRGQVGFVSPRAEFTPRTVETTELRTDLVYRLRVVVPEPGDGLRQGMPVTVHLPLGELEGERGAQRAPSVPEGC